MRRQLAIGYGHMVDAQGNPTQEVIAKNPQIYGKDVIDNLIVAGPVKSYLSFESNAECFNLGFTVEPGMVSWKIPGVESNEQSVAGTGVVIGRDVMMKNEVGLGMGIKKQKEPDTPTTEPKQEQADASTTVASGATEKVSDIADIPVVKS